VDSSVQERHDGGFCMHGNELWVSIKCFFDYLSHNFSLNVPCSYKVQI
jgi:hypothetical protein